MTFDPASFVFTPQDAPSEIRASTVLPARRENVEFTTEDGKVLLGELALPESGEITATLITLHPLPTHGGFMDSHVYRKASYRLPGAGRSRCPPVQHPRHPVAAGHQRRPLRRGHWRALRRRGGRAVRRRTGPAEPLARGMVLRHRARPDVRRGGAGGLSRSKVQCCCRRLCTGPRMSTSRSGPPPASR